MQSANRKINSRKCKHEWKMEIITLHKSLDRETEKHGIKYHRVRHRNLGNAYAIELHLLLSRRKHPSDRRTGRLTAIESEIEKSIQPRASVLTIWKQLKITPRRTSIAPTNPEKQMVNFNHRTAAKYQSSMFEIHLNAKYKTVIRSLFETMKR